MTKTEEIKAALAYKDGSFYVGGMAFCHVCSLLNAGYPPKNFDKSLAEAAPRTIHEVHEYLQPYITHMRKHPKKICPHCNSIIDA